MSDHGVVLESGAVRFERVLPGPIDRVWAYLTDPEKRGKWLATGPMELRPGGAVELRFRHADLSPVAEPIPERFKGMEGGATSHGHVTRCEPPRLLGMTWNEAPGKAPENTSEVTFELSERGEEVLLVLTHRRLPDRAGMVMVSGGWHAHLQVLSDHLAGRDPQPFWAAFGKLESDYERLIA